MRCVLAHIQSTPYSRTKEKSCMSMNQTAEIQSDSFKLNSATENYIYVCRILPFEYFNIYSSDRKVVWNPVVKFKSVPDDWERFQRILRIWHSWCATHTHDRNVVSNLWWGKSKICTLLTKKMCGNEKCFTQRIQLEFHSVKEIRA